MANLSAARVWVDTWEGKRLVETRSDAAGHFRLGPIEPVYRPQVPILIEANGFARQYVRRGSYSIFPSVDCSLGQIRLDHGRVFTASADVDGRPSRNAEVDWVFNVSEQG